MLFAVGSEKAAIENQKQVLFAKKICKADLIPIKIWQCEIWSGFV